MLVAKPRTCCPPPAAALRAAYARCARVFSLLFCRFHSVILPPKCLVCKNSFLSAAHQKTYSAAQRAGVARRQVHHERMRDERAREAAAGDAMSSSSHLGRRIARNGGSDSSVVLTVATLDYLPLLLNLLCSVAAAVEAGRWGGYGLVVVAADSGLCARLAPFGERGSYGRNVLADCIEPTSPRLATGRDAYMLKLEAMEGALSHLANQGEATPLAFFVDASSVRCARKEAYAVLRWN